MFGHFASSHTVLKACSRTISLTAANSFPALKGTRSQVGLRSAGAAAPGAAPCAAAFGLTPSLIAVKP